MLRQTAARISHRLLSRRLRRILKRFRKDTDGVTAVEFAFIAVPFFSLLLVIFESALTFFTQQGLEAATAEAARVIMTGQRVSGTPINGTTLSSSDAFRTQVMCTLRSLPSFIDCTKLIIDARNQSGFAGVNLSGSFYTGNTVFQTGGANCVVVLRVVYPMPVFLNFLTTADGISPTGVNRTGQTNYGGGWKHMLLATQVFRNEPFGASTAPSC
ncbi:MAG TPA: TadE family protein [Beijerinckiaceae bacterium]|jgi:Flp pilus assembly protein TadG|nr:TadE family protein [Beijerinckiaceae bacterium]